MAQILSRNTFLANIFRLNVRLFTTSILKTTNSLTSTTYKILQKNLTKTIYKNKALISDINLFHNQKIYFHGTALLRQKDDCDSKDPKKEQPKDQQKSHTRSHTSRSAKPHQKISRDTGYN